MQVFQISDFENTLTEKKDFFLSPELKQWKKIIPVLTNNKLHQKA